MRAPVRGIALIHATSHSTVMYSSNTERVTRARDVAAAPMVASETPLVQAYRATSRLGRLHVAGKRSSFITVASSCPLLPC